LDSGATIDGGRHPISAKRLELTIPLRLAKYQLMPKSLAKKGH